MNERTRFGPADRDGRDSPGRFGASATVEVDRRSVGAVDISYNPATDGDADPGEIVWTWVPYEENDGRGKDRPVLVVAREAGGTVLAVQLTSKPHDDLDDVSIGSGAWDSAGRPSWVRLERVFRLHQAGMRREAVALDAPHFALVARALGSRFGWRERSPAQATTAAGQSGRLAARPGAHAGRTVSTGSRTSPPASRPNALIRAIRRVMPRFGAKKGSK
jgi:hypothetical protein